MGIVGSSHSVHSPRIRWMRHVLSKSVRKHVELIASVPKMLNPLHLVATVVDETLIEEREVLPFLDHHIGLE